MYLQCVFLKISTGKFILIKKKVKCTVFQYLFCEAGCKTEIIHFDSTYK